MMGSVKSQIFSAGVVTVAPFQAMKPRPTARAIHKQKTILNWAQNPIKTH